MIWIILITLAVIQGITEFLPVSSSGHLVLFYNIFDITESTIFLSVIFHIATLFSIMVYYRKDLIVLLSHPFCSTNRKIIVTTICTCIVALFLKPLIDFGFGGDYLSTFFVITAILLLVSDYVTEHNRRKLRITNISDIFIQTPEYLCNLPITYTQAIVIGLTQGIACIPGISRSGTTIATAKFMGIDKDSSRYSFIICIPIIIASLVLEIFDGGSIGGMNVFALILSFLICFGVGLLSIKAMNKLTISNKLSYFSFYLFALAIFLILNSLFFHLF